MKIVRENINFERGAKDPKRSIGIGRFYEIWREKNENSPIIKITADLSRSGPDKAMIEVFLSYKSEEERNNEKVDTLFFEENQLGVGTLRPEQCFPGRDEAIHYNNPEAFNKEIIDTLDNHGDKGARDLIEEYIKEWWEDDRGLDQIIQDWVKTGSWTVDYVEVESLV